MQFKKYNLTIKMFFKISFVQKYFVTFFVLAAIAALAYAGSEESVSFPTPIESYGDGDGHDGESILVLSCCYRHWCSCSCYICQ